MPRAIRIHPGDSVAVALQALAPGDDLVIDSAHVIVRAAIPAGHKVALRDHDRGDRPVKYGFPIGVMEQPVRAGGHVHSHNLRTALTEHVDYRYEPERADREKTPHSLPTAQSFQGYRRAGGRVGTRNELWILNTVGCVNHAAERIGRAASDRFKGQVDGVYAFGHPYGCSQLGDDLGHTRQVLAGLMRHPNAGGVLVLGLGCESNQMDALLALAVTVEPDRLRFFNSQDVTDEVDAGLEALGQLVAAIGGDRREE